MPADDTLIEAAHKIESLTAEAAALRKLAGCPWCGEGVAPATTMIDRQRHFETCRESPMAARVTEKHQEISRRGERIRDLERIAVDLGQQVAAGETSIAALEEEIRLLRSRGTVVGIAAADLRCGDAVTVDADGKITPAALADPPTQAEPDPSMDLAEGILGVMRQLRRGHAAGLFDEVEAQRLHVVLIQAISLATGL